MISHYLELLYSNCKALAKSKDFNALELRSFFNDKVSAILIEFNLSSETDLVNLLIGKEYSQLSDVFSRSTYLKVFYLVNSFNEYTQSDESFDDLGRYKYDCSIIKYEGIENNSVLNLIQQTVDENEFLRRCFI
jgi:hypothetical protein